ncbi:hypothetical protein KQR56_06490 [Bacillus velezensis]|nr:hypothetical protein [Bacillus velezensis]
MNAISVKEIEHGVAVAEREGLGSIYTKNRFLKMFAPFPQRENGHTVLAKRRRTHHRTHRSRKRRRTHHRTHRSREEKTDASPDTPFPQREDGRIAGHTVPATRRSHQKRSRKRCFKC